MIARVFLCFALATAERRVNARPRAAPPPWPAGRRARAKEKRLKREGPINETFK
jgi:hypothetical protein